MNKTPMIHRTAAAGQTPAWQRELATAIRAPAELLQALQLPLDLLPAAEAASRDFPLRVPHSYLRRMLPGNPADPLLRQVLPLAEELSPAVGFSADPVGDQAAMALPGLIHKYHGRVLLTLTGACAVHCRYCFRRHFPYTEANPAEDHWQASIEYLQVHPEVTEVILSGGDPLSLSDRRLGRLVARLEEVPQLVRLRWHSRVPVVLPSRLTPELLQLWQSSRLQQVLVLHFNHPHEINNEVIQSLKILKGMDLTVLNQTVLLRGVNDDVTTLATLSEQLFAAGVLPYYLHLLDRTQGAAHFEVALPTAGRLYQGLLASLPGYLVPRLVRDNVGEDAKQPVFVPPAT
ncbi:MAG: EF-P beta-lysylation protein EpmB [Gammaproteobacteria bacterium]